MKQDKFDDGQKLKSSVKRKWEMLEHSYENVKSQPSVIDIAEKLQASLSAEFPSFLKSMHPSNVSTGFYLKLPKTFCDLYMPQHDETMILIDESGEEYETKFLAERKSLSGGWRRFSCLKKLFVGDVLVFHLIKPSKFMVYIVRANSTAEVDVALSLLSLSANANRPTLGKGWREEWSGSS